MNGGFLKKGSKILKEEGFFKLVKISLGYYIWPIFARPIAYLRHGYYRLKWRDAAPDPYRLIYIDPQDIDYVLTPYFRPLVSRDGTYVRGGDWDLRKKELDQMFDHPHDATFQEKMALVPLDGYLLFHSMKEFLLEGVSWNRTEFYRWRSDLDHPLKDTEYKLDSMGVKIQDLYEDIKKRGFKTQRELDERPFFRPPEYDEITVVIGRDGELFLETAGRHRFFIAKILGIPKVPARVLVRHSDWQDVRVETTRSDGVSRDHPDLKDVP